MTSLSIFFSLGLCFTVSGLSQQASRRTFLIQLPTAAAGVTTAGFLLAPHDVDCFCSTCAPHDGACSCVACLGVPPAGAFERRDVGDEGRSADTAALNEQAYLTQSRLEQQGFKLETEQEQITSLSAALSDYSYAPSSSMSEKNKKNKQQASKQQREGWN